MKQLKNWKIRRSGSGMSIDFDQEIGGRRRHLTRAKSVSVQGGKIIADYEDTMGQKLQAELVPPDTNAEHAFRAGYSYACGPDGIAHGTADEGWAVYRPGA